MPNKRSIIDRSLRTISLRNRKSKVSLEEFAKPYARGGTFRKWVDGLPRILAAKDLAEIVEAVREARSAGRPILFGLGAHVIKVGLVPVFLDLMKRGFVSGLALNGAGAIHDLELALVGRTSEDVEAGLGDGSFGMAEETSTHLNRAVREGHTKGWGLGRSVGEYILRSDFPHRGQSLFARAADQNIPATVHLSIGTDVNQMHASFDGEAFGGASHRDFRRFCELVGELDGGIYFNVGSAVLLPEVFLKALTVARNLGKRVRSFTTVNFDFIKHYRPTRNVIERPTRKGGRGYELFGHHEILIPLLAAMLIDR
ncbi:MAG: hypothetical protein ACRD1Z_04035, partial [Vicinamibacteria bacterium]